MKTVTRTPDRPRGAIRVMVKFDGACRCATPRQCSLPGRCTAASALRASTGSSALAWGPGCASPVKLDHYPNTPTRAAMRSVAVL